GLRISRVNCSRRGLVYKRTAAESRRRKLEDVMTVKISLIRAALAAAVFGALWGTTVNADEGMWLLNAPPRAILKRRHDFELSDAWIERAMKASVRFNNGGSGGFVSSEGLIVTNHHIGAGSIQKVSPKGKDYLRDGYYAKTRKQELKCPDLELNVLQEIL